MKKHRSYRSSSPLSCAAFFSVLLLAAASHIEVAHAAKVRIAGRVVNASQKDKPTAGATVKLVKVTEGQQAHTHDLATLKSDARGAFSASVNVGEKDLLFARVEWGGYPYVSPIYDASGQMGINLDPESLRLRVYDTTEVEPDLVFTVQHIAIKSEGNNLNCTERIVVENPSNKTYVGAGKEAVTILLPVPKGAQNVKLDETITDGKLITVGEKTKVYGVAKPIMPAASGERNAIIVTYSLPWKKEVDLTRSLQYPVRFFFVAREESDKGLRVSAPNLGKDETQPLEIDGAQQTRIVNAIGQPMSPEPVLQRGQPVEIKVSRPTNPLVWAFAALVGGLCLLIPVALLKPKKKSRVAGGENRENKVSTRGAAQAVNAAQTANAAEPASVASVNGVIRSQSSVSDAAESPQLRQIVDQIAQLDEQWEQGNLQRADYEAQRAQLKERALEQWTQAGN